jgi:hypothetical protein
LEYLDADESVILKRIQRRTDWREWTDFIWLRMWTGGESLWIRQRSVGLQEISEISGQAEELLACEGQCYVGVG